DRGEDDVRVLGGLGPVGVHTNDPGVARFLSRSSGAKTHGASHGQNDVRTLVNEALGKVLTLGQVLEVLSEGTGGAVPTEHLNGRAVGFVVVVHTSEEAIHEDHHTGDL